MQPITKAQIIQQFEFQDTDTILAFAKSANDAVDHLLAQRGFVREMPSDPEPTGDSKDASSDPDSPVTTIPADFPAAKQLLAGGVGTFLELAARSDEELLEIEGIGAATLVKIREAAPPQ